MKTHIIFGALALLFLLCFAAFAFACIGAPASDLFALHAGAGLALCATLACAFMSHSELAHDQRLRNYNTKN